MDVNKLIKSVERVNMYSSAAEEAVNRIKMLNVNLKNENNRKYPFLFTTKEWYYKEINRNFNLISYIEKRIKQIKLT